MLYSASPLVLEFIKENCQCPERELLIQTVNERYYTDEYGHIAHPFDITQEELDAMIEDLKQRKRIYVYADEAHLSSDGERVLEHAKKHLQPWQPPPERSCFR